MTDPTASVLPIHLVLGSRNRKKCGEMADLIVELRSLTMGVGTFDWGFDHLQELTGRLADEVVQRHTKPVAAQ